MKTEELKRQETQKEKILNLLREKPNGITNEELSKIALRYGSYICYLNKHGYKIEKLALERGLFVYKLISEPIEKVERGTAYESLMLTLQNKGFSSVADSLSDILNEAGVNIRFKAGTYQ